MKRKHGKDTKAESTGARLSKRKKNSVLNASKGENERTDTEVAEQTSEEESTSTEFSDCLTSDSDSDTETMRTKYMRERMEIARKRENMLLELNISTLTQKVHDTVSKKTPKRNTARQFQKVTKKREVTRRSLRVLKKDPAIIEPNTHVDSTPAEVKNYDVSNDEFALSAVGFEQLNIDEVKTAEREKVQKQYNHYDAFIESLKTAPVLKKGSQPSLSQETLKNNMKTFKVKPENVRRVTQKRIFSMAVHPSSSDILVAAGDTVGNIGLWKPCLKDSNSGTYMFHGSGAAINTLKFSQINPSKLYMASYSGQLRCLDLRKSVFEKTLIYDEASAVTSFDFIGPGHTVAAAHKSGDLTICDTRESGLERPSMTLQGPKASIKCLSCHPVDHQYLLTSYLDGSVLFFDLRNSSRGRKKPAKELFSLKGHSRSVNAAYFSPLSGSSVLTTCLDSMLRVYDSKVIGQDQVNMRASCRHDNWTGRWLTPFKATWHPECEDIFVVGSMRKPRQLDVYNDRAKIVQTLQNPEVLTTVSSVNCFFKSSHLFAGNAGGKVFMFSNQK